jgi:hypothetical protein
MCRRRWRLALALGVLFASFSVLIVLGSEDSTWRPGGLEFIGAIVWRGLVYGGIDDEAPAKSWSELSHAFRNTAMPSLS